jgi:hypothetical protein
MHELHEPGKNWLDVHILITSISVLTSSILLIEHKEPLADLQCDAGNSVENSKLGPGACHRQ